MPQERKAGHQKSSQSEGQTNMSRKDRKAAIKYARNLSEAMFSTGSVNQLPRTFQGIEGELRLGGKVEGQE